MEIFVKSFEDLDINELYKILKLRVDVFVVEQACPYPEIDGIDKEAFHIFAKDNGEIGAYARIYKENEEIHLGRVIAKERRKGYGTRVLKAAIKAAEDNYKAEKIHIEAQTYAKNLYKKVGFVEDSDVFLLDGIRHIKMVLDLTNYKNKKIAENIFLELTCPTKEEIKKLIDKSLVNHNQADTVEKAFEEIWDEINKEN